MAIDKPHGLDQIMKQASASLGQLDYLACEAFCRQALTLAAAEKKWAYYARILLPLQEARRQRRLIAAEGVIRLGTRDLTGDPVLWLRRVRRGCLVVTPPHDQTTARTLIKAVRSQRLYVEILLAQVNEGVCLDWTLVSVDGMPVSCVVPAPLSRWQDRWLEPDPRSDGDGATPAGEGRSDPGPAHWFLDACEALGDASLNQIRVPLGDPMRVKQLERCLQAVIDHENLHQALAEAARALV